MNHSTVSSCNCTQCGEKKFSEEEKLKHRSVVSENRRAFISKSGKLAISMGFGGGLIAQPLAAAALHDMDASARDAEILRNPSIQKGKAEIITLLHTADIHAQLFTHDEFFIEQGKPVYKKRGGYSVLKTMINELRLKNPFNTLVIDGGDCFQGGGVAALSEGRAIVPLMNNIGYDIMLPGNWEVVYGKEMMMKDMFAYNGVKVCANMFHQTTDPQNGELIFPPYYIRYIAGIKIGFIGYNDPLTPKRQSPAYSDGIKFTMPEINLERYIRILKEYEGCKMIFLLTHMGLAQQVGLSSIPQVQGADYILGADTHERVRTPIEGKYAKVTEPGAFGSFVAKLDIVVENGEVKEHNYQLLDVDPTLYKEDEEMKNLLQKARAPYKERLDKVIGKTKSVLVRYYVLETPMDNMITDAIMWKYSPDIALSNGFRFCPPLVPDHKTGVAEITEDFLWSMLPVDSYAKTGSISGKKLWDWMEQELHNAFAKDPAKRFGGWVVRFNGMEVKFTIGNEKGKRVQYIKVKGKSVDFKKLYSFVACEREGDPDTTICRVEGVTNPKRLDLALHDIMKEYLAKHSPVSPRIEGRCTATDAPQELLTQLMGFGYEFR